MTVVQQGDGWRRHAKPRRDGTGDVVVQKGAGFVRHGAQTRIAPEDKARVRRPEIDHASHGTFGPKHPDDAGPKGFK